jgi:hypothetical protein
LKEGQTGISINSRIQQQRLIATAQMQVNEACLGFCFERNWIMRESQAIGTIGAEPACGAWIRDWQRWAPYAAVAWSPFYAALGAYSALNGRGFHGSPTTGSNDIGPLMGRFGRRVPIALAVVPASLVSVLLIVGGIAIWSALPGMVARVLAGGAKGMGIIGEIVFPIGPTLLFPMWGVALAVATLGYYYRRRGPCRVYGRDA